MIYKDKVVDLPKAPHKIRITKSKAGASYVQLEVGKERKKGKKNPVAVRVSIGVLCEGDEGKMHPNDKYFEYFNSTSDAAVDSSIATSGDTSSSGSVSSAGAGRTSSASSKDAGMRELRAELQKALQKWNEEEESSLVWSFPASLQGKYGQDGRVPGEDVAPSLRRSRVMRVGSFIAIKHVLREIGLPFSVRDGLVDNFEDGDQYIDFLDLAAFSIMSQFDKSLQYGEYSYNHYLFNETQTALTSQQISQKLLNFDPDMLGCFYQSWIEETKDGDHALIYFDSARKNCKSGDLDIGEFDKVQIDSSNSLLSLIVALDASKATPIVFDHIARPILSAREVVGLANVLKDSYDYKKFTLFMDRGTFSGKKFKLLDDAGIDVLMMMAPSKPLVKDLIAEHKNSLESIFMEHQGKQISCLGKTIEKELFGKTRYIHLFYSTDKRAEELCGFQERFLYAIESFRSVLGKEIRITDPSLLQYLKSSAKDTSVLTDLQNEMVDVQETLGLQGYFCLITSEKVSAAQAYMQYLKLSSYESSLKVNKAFIGEQMLNEDKAGAVSGFLFIQFLALIIRSEFAKKLANLGIETLYEDISFTVAKALNDLDTIEVIQSEVGKPYSLSCAISTKAQKLLKALGITKEELMLELGLIYKNKHLYSIDAQSSRLSEIKEQEEEEFALGAESKGLRALEYAIVYDRIAKYIMNDDDEDDDYDEDEDDDYYDDEDDLPNLFRYL